MFELTVNSTKYYGV